MYQIYTFPACEKCHKAVDLFKERGIPHEEISAGTSEGRNRLKEFTKKYNDEIRRDENGWTLLPIIVSGNGEDLRIYQGEDGIEEVLEDESLRVSR